MKRAATSTIECLTEGERDEALEFLSERPLHTVIMSGWIRERGVESPEHLGKLYRTRGPDDRIDGIALIGKHTFFEVRSKQALRLVAKRARGVPEIRMVFAEQSLLSEFWRLYGEPSARPRMKSSEFLIDISEGKSAGRRLPRLRAASKEELEPVARAHASMVLEETGIDPLLTDPKGFRARCLSRIDQGRVWVWMKDGELLFKTDVIADTPDACYIEGLWLNPAIRSTGSSARCLSSLCRKLLNGRNSIVGFVDAGNSAAIKLYRNSGFNFRERYAKIYI